MGVWGRHFFSQVGIFHKEERSPKGGTKSGQREGRTKKGMAIRDGLSGKFNNLMNEQ